MAQGTGMYEMMGNCGYIIVPAPEGMSQEDTVDISQKAITALQNMIAQENAINNTNHVFTPDGTVGNDGKILLAFQGEIGNMVYTGREALDVYVTINENGLISSSLFAKGEDAYMPSNMEELESLLP